MSKTTTHIYEVQTAEGDIVDVLRFSTPAEAAKFASDLNGDYYVKPQSLSAEELLEIVLDMRDLELADMATEYIGDIGVDSGMIMIADPCHVKKPMTDEVLDAMYNRTNNKQKAGPALHSFNVALQPGYGDGSYAVYAKYNEDGKIVKVEIDAS